MPAHCFREIYYCCCTVSEHGELKSRYLSGCLEEVSMPDRAHSTMHTKAKQNPEKQLDLVPCVPALAHGTGTGLSALFCTIAAAAAAAVSYPGCLFL